MDRQPEASLTFASLRRFLLVATAALAAPAGLLALVSATRAAALGALLGGGWMLASCGTLYAIAILALQGDVGARARTLTRLVFAMIGFLLAGGALLMLARPSLLGLTLGITVVVALFLRQLTRLRAPLAAAGSDGR